MRFLPFITIFAAVGVAGLAGAADLANNDRLSIPQDDTLGLDCVAEASAFTEVAELAYVYNSDGEIFAGALFDLREQLLECLATSSEDRTQSLTPGGRDATSI